MNKDITYRSITLERGAIDQDARTVTLGVSSEEPVYRASFGMDEVLDHSQGSINMDFMSSGRAPLLMDHDPTRQVGVIDEFVLDPTDRRTRAVARFGRSAEATEAFNDVVDGIRTNISVGYMINETERASENGENFMRVTSWTPMESSLVSIPADQSALVGVGRSQNEPDEEPTEEPVEETNQEEIRVMVEDNQQPTQPSIDVDAIKRQTSDDVLKAERARVDEIEALGKEYRQPEMASDAIRDGIDVPSFTGRLLVASKTTPVEVAQRDDIGLTPKETRSFSLARWINAQAHPGSRNAQESAAFEIEAMDVATRENSYKGGEGQTVPAEVFRNWSQRDVNTTDDAGGVGEDFMPGDFIEALRNASAVGQAGATVMSGLNSDVKIPKQTGTSTAGWVSSEGGNTSESELTLGSITLAPKTAGMYTEVTAQMLAQASGAGAIGIENIIRQDILSANALLIDLGATAGSGSSGQPTGIDNATGTNTQTLTTANTYTWAEAINAESLCLTDNAIFGNPGYILNATQVGLAKGKVKESGQASYVMEDDRINGHPVFISNNITAGSTYFSVDWSQLILAFFGTGPNLLVDPYTSSASGTVRLRVLQFVDIGVRHAQAFTHSSGGS